MATTIDADETCNKDNMPAIAILFSSSFFLVEMLSWISLVFNV